MNSQNNGQTEFRVVLVGNVKADLRRFHQELMLRGKGTDFLVVMQQVHDRLRHDPRNFGEEQYRLPALKCLVYKGIIAPLAVSYGVHDELPIVFVNIAKLLSPPEA